MPDLDGGEAAASDQLTLEDADDRKLVTLARSTRARVQAAQGACVRDLDGRTYAAASVELPSLRLGALEVAVAMAVSSGASGLEAGVLLTDGLSSAEGVGAHDLAVVRELAGEGVPVWAGDQRGRLHSESRT